MMKTQMRVNLKKSKRLEHEIRTIVEVENRCACNKAKAQWLTGEKNFSIAWKRKGIIKRLSHILLMTIIAKYRILLILLLLKHVFTKVCTPR